MEMVFSFSTKPPTSSVIHLQPPTISLSRSDAQIQIFDWKISSSRRPIRAQCRSFGGNNSSSTDSGEKDSKAALDAFFLGKALAEAINERIVSNVGEFLSVVGQWQAEQQKHVQEFQEEVLQKAKKEKDKAAAEALAAVSGISASQGGPSARAISSPPSEANNDDDDDGDLLGDMLKG